MVRKGISKAFHYLNILADSAAAASALIAAYYLRFSGWPIPVRHEKPEIALYLQALPVVVIVVLISYQYAGLYLQRRGISGVDEFSKIVRATTVSFFILIGLTYFWRRAEYSRVGLIYAWALTIVLVAMLRTFLRRMQVVLRRRGVGLCRVVLVGMTQTSKTVAEQIKRYPGLGYRLIGLVAEQAGPVSGFEGLRMLGRIEELPDIIRNEDIDEVIFALPAETLGKLEDVLLSIETTGVDFKIVSDLFGIITNPLTIDEIYGIPVFALKESPLSGRLARVVKRTMDLAVAIPGLIILMPFLLVVALAIKLSSPGPVFFKQERVGRGNKPFVVYKFRSMRVDAEKETGPVWATKDDVRTTRIGAFLRKSSLDELPQLFNVLRGEMSMVGPRPERPHFVNQFKTIIPRYLERHKVKAGLTGWAQVHGLRGNTPVEERVKYDLWYVENWSLILDVKIIMRTILGVFHHKDAY
ncbi:undecaprenyl-phosphate glucose phosphotransferase [candidate division FCPU426 bacterium]|nr:undecaprenyl-phosphate glucose phosphotransferase [candidate division FCPU426 bacterium]